MDVSQLILDDHHEQRRLFALLDDVGRDQTEALAALWGRLRTFLELHAAAEEELFYPALLDIGTGARDDGTVEDEVEDVIKDHNDIRDAAAEVDRHPVGSDAWWQAVLEARNANDEHMAEEERDDVADFRRHADPQLRHRLGVAFATFEAQHAQGVRAVDKDPERYVAENT
jgi:hypothetical protein